MTAYSADELIRQGMAEGIKTILTKPLDIDFLLVLLRPPEYPFRERITAPHLHRGINPPG